MPRNKVIMSAARRRICELDAASIAYYRRNPCIAARDLLGIELLDSQKYILQHTWNASHAVWCCSRNFGKTFVGAVFLLLKAILYENQAIYIISSVGDQAKETFSKIEELVLRTGKTASSFKDLKDIAEKETVKSPTNKTGFSHSPQGYEIHFYNGSAIYTLNSNPDNARSEPLVAYIKNKSTRRNFIYVKNLDKRRNQLHQRTFKRYDRKGNCRSFGPHTERRSKAA